MDDQPEDSPVDRPPASVIPFVAAVVAALVPVVVGGVRAVAGEWRAEYDAGYFVARSLDVLTEHSPQVGAWSSQALYVQDSYNNVGPLFFYLLSPFVRMDVAWGVALGVAFINVAAVITVAWAARRWLGDRLAAIALLITVLLEIGVGALALVDPRQQLALLLPSWAMLVLTPLVMRGDPWAATPWVLFGSLCLQTHFTYAFLVTGLVIVGTVGYLMRLRDGGRARSVGLAVALLGAVLVWLPTAWDQIAGSGNLGRVLTQGGARSGAGLDEALQIMGSSPLSVVGWWPGWLRRFAEPWPVSIAVATVLVGLWFVGLGAIALGRLGPRHRGSARLAIGVLAVAVYTSARIPRLGAFGNLPQNHFWLWPVAGFALLVALAAIVERLPASAGPARSALTWGPAGLGGVAAVVAATTGMVFPQWDVSDQLTGGVGRRVVHSTEAAVAELLEDGELRSGEAVLVAPSPVGVRLLIPDHYNVLGVMRAAGLDVHFVPDADDLNRFGAERCRDGSERWTLLIERRPADADQPADRLVLADVSTETDPEADLDAVRRAMVDALAADRFRHDGSTAVIELIERAQEDPETTAEELLFYFPPALNSGAITVPAELAALVSQWQTLEMTGVAQAVVVSLAPVSPGPTCDD